MLEYFRHWKLVALVIRRGSLILLLVKIRRDAAASGFMLAHSSLPLSTPYTIQLLNWTENWAASITTCLTLTLRWYYSRILFWRSILVLLVLLINLFLTLRTLRTRWCWERELRSNNSHHNHTLSGRFIARGMKYKTLDDDDDDEDVCGVTLLGRLLNIRFSKIVEDTIAWQRNI